MHADPGPPLPSNAHFTPIRIQFLQALGRTNLPGRVTQDRTLLPEVTGQGSTRKLSAPQVEERFQRGTPRRGWPEASGTQLQRHSSQGGREGQRNAVPGSPKGDAVEAGTRSASSLLTIPRLSLSFPSKGTRCLKQTSQQAMPKHTVFPHSRVPSDFLVHK